MNSTNSFDTLNSSNSSNTSNNSLLGILLAISPLIIGGFVAILCCMYYIIFNIKTKCYYSYIDYYDNKLKPIKNRQLNINYIKEINIQNKNIEHYDSSTCSICLEDITNNTPNISCGHLFHRKCLLQHFQSQNNNYSCPLCRKKLDIQIKNDEIISIRSKDNTNILKLQVDI